MMDFHVPDVDLATFRPILDTLQVNAPFCHLMHGYQQPFLELGLNPEIGLDAIALEQFSRDDFKAIAAEHRNRGRIITLHGPFWDLSPGSPDEAIRAVTRRRFEQLLAHVHLFEPQTVVCHAGYDRKRYITMRGDWLKRSLDFWSWLADGLSTAGTRLMLENVYEHCPEDLEPLLDALAPQGVGFCLDLGHQSAFGRAPLAQWLAVLGRHIGQLHLHDNNGETDQHLALGRGAIDFKPLWQWLAAQERPKRPVITIEPHTVDDFWGSLAYFREVQPW